MTQAKEVIWITGCSGRVGTRVAKKFSDSRYAVIGLDIVTPRISSANFEFIKCDLTKEESCNQAISHIREKYGDRISSIIHLAASYGYVGEAWASQESIQTKGTERLLQAAKTFHTEQFVFASSVQVHAPCEPGQRINENWPILASAHAARSNVEQDEFMLQQKHGEIPLVTLRIAPCYDELCHSIPLSHQIQRLYEKEFTASFFPGDLTRGFSYVHLEDLSDALWLIVQRRFGLSRELAFVIGEAETVSYGELQKVIGLLLTGEEYVTLQVPKWVAKWWVFATNRLPFMKRTSLEPWMIDMADLNYSINSSFIQEKLGWATKRSLRQTLPKMINALKENRLAFYRENSLTLPVPKK